jgi:hypothetical protein
MPNKVQIVKNGIHKKWKSTDDVMAENCPVCKREMEDIADLYTQPNPDICTEWARRKQSMESRFYQCHNCNKTFVYWEWGDYEVFHLQEVTIPQRRC